MHRTETTTRYYCDVCNKECSPIRDKLRYTVRYINGEQSGILVWLKTFGVIGHDSADTDICKDCAIKVLKTVLKIVTND